MPVIAVVLGALLFASCDPTVPDHDHDLGKSDVANPPPHVLAIKACDRAFARATDAQAVDTYWRCLLTANDDVAGARPPRAAVGLRRLARDLDVASRSQCEDGRDDRLAGCAGE